MQIIAADRRSQMNLKQDERLSGELITGRRQLLEGMAFPQYRYRRPGEKLS
ncbi:hypothetical protein ECZU23_53530 [Escherichia coli]|nr:hypothetical protein ECZU23_53530 [Escherichia coli]